MKKFYLIVGLIAIVLRLVLMPITVHSDLWAFFFSGHLLVFKGVFNIYDYLANLPQDDSLLKNYGTNFFTYPPLSYFFLGFFTFLFRPFFDGDLFNWVASHYPYLYQNSQIFLVIFFQKLPYLFFDLGVAFLLVKLFKKEQEKKLAFLLWMFNPLTIYTSFMVGQFDVIPLFFTVLALLLAVRSKRELAALSLGMGGALKMFPLLFLPFLVLVLGKTNREKIKLALLGILPYLFSVLPFLSSVAFRQVSLFAQQSQKMLHMSLPVSGAEGIYLFVFFFGLLVILAGYTKRGTPFLWWYFLATMLLFFSLTHYHPQWFLWLTPFLIMEMVKNRLAYLWLGIILFLSWFFITLAFEPSLNFALFVPLFPNLEKLPGLFEGIQIVDLFQIKSLVRSVFAASSLFLLWLVWQRHEKTT